MPAVSHVYHAARKETLRRALSDAQRRLGRLLAGPAAPRGKAAASALRKENTDPVALLLALKIRDLSIELEAAMRQPGGRPPNSF